MLAFRSRWISRIAAHAQESVLRGVLGYIGAAAGPVGEPTAAATGLSFLLAEVAVGAEFALAGRYGSEQRRAGRPGIGHCHFDVAEGSSLWSDQLCRQLPDQVCSCLPFGKRFRISWIAARHALNSVPSLAFLLQGDGIGFC